LPTQTMFLARQFHQRPAKKIGAFEPIVLLQSHNSGSEQQKKEEFWNPKEFQILLAVG
jgi:hypothetical protein